MTVVAREAVGVLLLAVSLVACGGADDTEKATAGAEETSSTTAAVKDVQELTVTFDGLPDGYEEAPETSGVSMFSLGGDDPGEPTAQGGVRRTSPPEHPVSVSVFADRADLFAGFADDAERSALRGGSAVVNRHDVVTIVLWVESGAFVWVNAPSQIPENELAAIVDAVRLVHA